MTVNAITLWQPHATLVALLIKLIETRSWAPPASAIGQPIAIHAAKREPDNADAEQGRTNWPIGDWIVTWGHDGWHVVLAEKRGDYSEGSPYSLLPLGAIVATATLADVVPIGSYASLSGPPVWAAHLLPVEGSDAERAILVRDERFAAEAIATDGPLPAEIDATDQLPYGDFTPGRYAWLLEDIKPTTERCPACWGQERSPVAGCSTCNSSGRCNPIPAKGHQGLWKWDPAA